MAHAGILVIVQRRQWQEEHHNAVLGDGHALEQDAKSVAIVNVSGRRNNKIPWCLTTLRVAQDTYITGTV